MTAPSKFGRSLARIGTGWHGEVLSKPEAQLTFLNPLAREKRVARAEWLVSCHRNAFTACRPVTLSPSAGLRINSTKGLSPAVVGNDRDLRPGIRRGRFATGALRGHVSAALRLRGLGFHFVQGDRLRGGGGSGRRLSAFSGRPETIEPSPWPFAASARRGGFATKALRGRVFATLRLRGLGFPLRGLRAPAGRSE